MNLQTVEWQWSVKGTLLILCGLLSVSCSLDGKNWQLENRVSSSIGKHRNQLTKELGTPASETSLSEGGSRLLYIEVRKHSGKYGMMIRNEVCRTTLDADEAGIIRSATFHGCRQNEQ